MKRKHFDLYKIFIYVALISLAISIIIPVSWVFLASIKTNAEFYGNPWSLPQGFNIQNFIDAFQIAQVGDFILNSALVTATALVILLVVSLPAAYVLARFQFKGRKFFNTLIMAGLFINVNYIVVPIFLMLNGWDKSLAKSGLQFFMNNRFVLALVYASTAIPFTVYLLASYFRSLPKAYEEAAEIDGCGYFTTMVRVMFRMAKPSIITVILFNFLAFWNEYIISLTLVQTKALKTLPVGLQNLMSAQKAATNYGPMYAGLVIVMLPTLILYILVQRRLTQGMTLGGLKD
ncbi:MAG: carbohydrate ABC transporter permease [Solobacterium sp.]|nr:carbohydrate ABC transporter permease [Solobacterium sp.]